MLLLVQLQRLDHAGTLDIPVLSQWLFAAAVIAMLVPFFNDVVGLLGSLGFWPLTVFLPIQMHIAQTGTWTLVLLI